MIYKKSVHAKRFQSTLILLACFMVTSMSASGCSCGNHDRSKSGYANKGSIDMEVTPLELKGDQRTVTVTFVAKPSSKSKKSVSLAPYQLQVSFPQNMQIYYTSDKQRDQALQSQEKVKLEQLLSIKRPNTTQAITLTVVPDLNLQSLEVELKLVDAEDQLIQESTFRWKQDRSLSDIKIEVGHNHLNNKVIYALDNEGDETFTGIRFRYTNISTDEEGKKVMLDNQLTNTFPIPQLVGGERTGNQFVFIDFKNAQKATFRFEVIDQQGLVLATGEKVFNKDAPVPVGGSNSAFQRTILDGNIDQVKALLDKQKIDLNQIMYYKDENDRIFDIPGQTPVTFALEKGDWEMAKLLISKGADVNHRVARGFAALERAAMHSETDKTIVGELIRAGAEVNGSPTASSRPIHLAGRYGNVNMLQALLQTEQLDVNNQDINGSTVFHHLCSAMRVSEFDPGRAERLEKRPKIVEIMQKLIDKGADINKKNVLGDTPLHLFVRTVLPQEIFESILKLPGIQVNAQNNQGETPLHFLVRLYFDVKETYQANPEWLNFVSQQIALLIQYGADIHLKSKDWEDPTRPKYFGANEEKGKSRAGKSVLELAEASGDNKLIKLIKGEVA